MMSEFYLNSNEAEGKDFLPIVQSSAFLWGMSTFTTALIEKKCLYFGHSHLKRLQEGIHYLFNEERSLEDIESDLRSSLKKSELLKKGDLLKLRVTYFKDKSLSQLSYLVEVSPFIEMKERSCLQSIFRERSQQAFIDGIKMGSYGDSFKLQREPGREPFFYNHLGYYEDSAVSNILLRRREDGRWITPKGNFFKGIALREGLKNFPLFEADIRKEDRGQYDAAVLLNSLRGVIPLYKWDDQELCDKEGNFEGLKRAFQEQAQEEFIQL